jgi:DNA topoisomerase-3
LAKKEDVVAHALAVAEKKFEYFSKNIEAINALFEATFSPAIESSKLLSRCGKCRRIMKYIKLRPPRLHCTTCNETYGLPQNGTIKLFMGNTCPLDNFELVQFSLGNKAKAIGKTYVICPYCYSNPPFEGFTEGMSCDKCTHPTCPTSLVFNGVCPCPGEDDSDDTPGCEGTMVLDSTSHPNWKLCCNTCNQLMIFSGLHSLKVSKKSNCEECGSKILIIDFDKAKSPLGGDETVIKFVFFLA